MSAFNKKPRRCPPKMLTWAPSMRVQISDTITMGCRRERGARTPKMLISRLSWGAASMFGPMWRQPIHRGGAHYMKSVRCTANSMGAILETRLSCSPGGKSNGAGTWHTESECHRTYALDAGGQSG